MKTVNQRLFSSINVKIVNHLFFRQNALMTSYESLKWKPIIKKVNH
jgi:hypothetical protein